MCCLLRVGIEAEASAILARHRLARLHPLQLPQPPVQATTRNQRIVRAALLLAAACEDEDLVCLARAITA